MMNRNSILDDIKWQMQHGSMLIKIIFVNLGVFLTFHAVRIFLFLFLPDAMAVQSTTSAILNWLILPVALSQLIVKPWTLITHMFLHTGIFHILFNMLWLYWFGRIFKEFLGEKKLLPIYIMGGLFGAFLMILSFNLFPGLSANAHSVQALGASAGVMAVVLATTALVPNYSIFLFFLGQVKIKYIALVVILLDFISIGSGNTGGHIAHLGGAFFGFLYIKQLQSGKDVFAPVISLFDKAGKLLSFSKRIPRVVYRNKNVHYKKKQTADVHHGESAEKQSRTASKQERVDEILDKISTSGYDSLSKEEKEFLFRYSKED